MHQIDLIQADINRLKVINPADPVIEILNKMNYQLNCMAWDLARLANPPIHVCNCNKNAIKEPAEMQ